ncbi:23S rRNA (guanosine(2251)-2'-O)-methyltransferase RlmB [Patescibacteria group bacterium]|nr:23S rRNA (guanosine(2251)-2'-O)-methyltransferase RlmB [Patescibacteria group bacterium]
MAEKIFIYGRHAVEEALRNSPDTVSELFLENVGGDSALFALAKALGISLTRRMPREISMEVHQGIAASVLLPKLMRSYADFAASLKIGPDTSLVVLDELQDPQNVGAIIRSAAAFGVSGVLIPERRGAQVTGAAVKASAGMVFSIPLISIGNVNTAVRDLKERGFFAYGLAGGAKYVVTKEEFVLPSLFIIGAEAEGIREKTRELCDKLLSIPMSPKCESLNAAAAASVAFYAWSAKHAQALR